jgi:hypothetical protein
MVESFRIYFSIMSFFFGVSVFGQTIHIPLVKPTSLFVTVDRADTAGLEKHLFGNYVTIAYSLRFKGEKIGSLYCTNLMTKDAHNILELNLEGEAPSSYSFQSANNCFQAGASIQNLTASGTEVKITLDESSLAVVSIDYVK